MERTENKQTENEQTEVAAHIAKAKENTNLPDAAGGLRNSKGKSSGTGRK